MYIYIYIIITSNCSRSDFLVKLLFGCPLTSVGLFAAVTGVFFATGGLIRSNLSPQFIMSYSQTYGTVPSTFLGPEIPKLQGYQCVVIIKSI